MNHSSVADTLANLVKDFDSKSGRNFNEFQTRLSFIDQFWNALGWGVSDTQQVQIETRSRIAKRPDYRFFAGRKTAFFVEAKKPVENLKDPKHIFQAKSYCWSDSVPLVVLTDFEEFRPFRALGKPKLDKPKTGLIKEFDITYDQYPDYAERLLATFGRDAVLSGSLAELTAATPRELKETVDKAFLAELCDWREVIAKGVANRNSFTSEYELGEAVQRIVDRIVFLRILEDRDVEPDSPLASLAERGAKDIYKRFVAVCKSFAPKYNGLIFNPHPLSENLTVEDSVLRPILKSLYDESPYRFDAIPVEVLGTIYERFLGDEIRLTDGGRAKVETKPEVRHAGGVHYTPEFVVAYIVARTVCVLLANCRTPADVAKLKILDPACGSGSFLLYVFDVLIKWHEQYYAEHPEEMTEKAGRQTVRLAYVDEQGAVRLTSRMKGRILTNNIYGVDLDRQATEVAQMSLYLKVVEGLANEPDIALGFQEAILPKMDKNIHCGNSLIGSDFLSQDFFGLSEKEQRRINPFDWNDKFAAIMRSGGFDAVVGNPPYVRQEFLGDTKAYFQHSFRVYHGTADLYAYFIEQGMKLLKPNGLFGVIVANKWMRANYGEPLRRWMKEQRIVEITDFGDLPVFQNATTYPCILLLQKNAPAATLHAAEIRTLEFDLLEAHIREQQFEMNVSALDNAGWTLVDTRTKALLDKLRSTGTPLGEYVQGKIYYGIKTGLNEAFVIDAETRERLIAEHPGSAELIKPFLAGRDIKRYAEPLASTYVILIPKGWTRAKSYSGQAITPSKAWQWLQATYPAIANHLEPFADRGEQRYDKGEFWWELRACDYYAEFEKPKLMFPDIALRLNFTVDITDHFYCANTGYFIPTNDLFLLGIINSGVMDFVYRHISSSFRGGYLRAFTQYLIQLPIPTMNNKKPLSDLIETMLDLHKQKQSARNDFERENYGKLIAKTDREIDRIVYELYGLTEDEIAIVEDR